MSQYRFDGTHLYASGSQIGRVDRDSIYDARGSKIGRVDRDSIYDGRGSKVGRFDGQNIYDSRGSKVGTIDSVRKEIEGTGGATLAALWLLLVR